MQGFKLWLEGVEKKKIPERAVKIALPVVRQQKTWSCGAQAFRAICLYFNVGPKDEDEYIKMLGTNAKDGTWPEAIAKHAKRLGMAVELKNKMSIKELTGFLDKKIPVICAMQAWGKPKDYAKSKNGHYVVAIGYDKDHLFFEDPSVEGEKRGYLTHEEFDKRWHDIDCHGHKFHHLGIAIWKQNPEPHKKITKAKKIK